MDSNILVLRNSTSHEQEYAILLVYYWYIVTQAVHCILKKESCERMLLSI